MKLTLFVANAGSQSGRPGHSQNNLRIVLPPKSENVDDENKDVFPDPNTKSVSIDLTGLSDEEIAKFRAGNRVEVTINVS